MLSEKDRDFILYWEKVRDRQAGFGYKLLRGLPRAMLFFLSLPATFFLIDYFMPDWYYRVSGKMAISMPSVLIGLFIATIFLSFFSMQFRWEANENHYLALKQKEKFQNQSTS